MMDRNCGDYVEYGGGDRGFEPLGRSRANTWPLNQFGEEDGKPADQEPDPHGHLHPSIQETDQDTEEFRGSGGNVSGDGTVTPDLQVARSGTPGTGGGQSETSVGASAAKKNSSRRNAWGNMSYADLITQAIQSSSEGRLTLSQIYDWMVQNVPYFKDKGDSNSSAGWKNSIRHNLSLHNRFDRQQNEGTGKSSWWVINPTAKPGKSTRRRAASMETSKYEKRRGRVKKQVDEQRRRLGPLSVDAIHPHGLSLHSPSSPISESNEALYNAGRSDTHSPRHVHPLSEPFRSRTDSNASSFGRLSPCPNGELTPILSPHPWITDYDDRDSDFQPQLAELDTLANSMKLHDATLPAVSSANGRGFYQSSVPTWFHSQTVAALADGQSNGIDSLMAPYISVNTSLFSGGTFSSIPEEPPAAPVSSSKVRDGQTYQQRLNSCVQQQPPPSHQQQILRNNRSWPPGSFPADLDHFMDTVQPGLEIDVDAVLNHELNMEGNLDFNLDQFGYAGATVPVANGQKPNALNQWLSNLQGPTELRQKQCFNVQNF